MGLFEDLQGHEYTEKERIDYTKDLLNRLFAVYKETKDLGWFFRDALFPFSDPMAACSPGGNPGVLKEYGHFIYRLSDMVPEYERRKIPNYPDDEGKIIMDGVAWDSLENWRKEWEECYSPIPELAELLKSKYLPENARTLPSPFKV